MLMLKKKTQDAAPVPTPGPSEHTGTEPAITKKPSSEVAGLREKNELKSSTGAGVFGGGGGKGRRNQRSAAEVRAQKDITEMDLGAAPGASVELPDPNNCMELKVTITPTDNSCPWYGATYEFLIIVPTEYPHKAPRAECKTMIYHPNIDWEGHVCLNILRADWRPIYTLSSVVLGLHTLFTEANPNDPLNEDAGSHFRRDPDDFKKLVHKTLKGGNVEFTLKDKSKKSFTFPKFL